MGGIVSGEGVELDLMKAGIGSRVIAAMLDFLVQAGILFALIVFDAMVAADTDGTAFLALLIVQMVLIFGGYHILMEWLTGGRTLGKMALGLRVVRDDGGPIGFRQALVRGLSSLLLEKPGLFTPLGSAMALICMLARADHKRLGDLMAGTFVLRERAGTRLPVVAPDFGVPYEMQGWAATLDLSRVDDALALNIRQFVLRAQQMTPQARANFEQDFRRRLDALISPAAPPHVPTATLLVTVLAERRRRSQLAAAPAYAQPQAYVQPAAPAVEPSPWQKPPEGPPSSPGGFAAPS